MAVDEAGHDHRLAEVEDAVSGPAGLDVRERADVRDARAFDGDGAAFEDVAGVVLGDDGVGGVDHGVMAVLLLEWSGFRLCLASYPFGERLCNRKAPGARQESDMIVFLGVGSCLQASSQALSRDDPNKLLIIIVIETKGAQALRAAGQPVVAGLVLRNDAPRARATLAKFVVAP